MTDSKNTILAIVLSAIVLIVWQYFFAIPQEKARQGSSRSSAAGAEIKSAEVGDAGRLRRRTGVAARHRRFRPIGAALGGRSHDPRRGLAHRRVPIATGSLELDLAQGVASTIWRWSNSARPSTRSRADRAVVAVRQPRAVLRRIRLDPNAAGSYCRSDRGHCGKQSSTGALSVEHPVTLTFDNGQGLNSAAPSRSTTTYLFTVKDEVANKSDKPVLCYILRADLAPQCAANARLLHLARGHDRGNSATRA